jgi:hypothetical protein
MTDLTTKIWYNDISSFVSFENAKYFVPSNEMSFIEKVNSMMRFAIYFTIVLYFIQNNLRVFLIIPLFASITVVLEKLYKDGKITSKMGMEKFHSLGGVGTGVGSGVSSGEGVHTLSKEPHRLSKCNNKPTINNPFMNVLMNEYEENPTRGSACHDRKKIESKFNEKYFRNIDDIFLKNGADRQFYTTPNTTIPNNQTDFANWLYKQEGDTFKEQYISQHSDNKPLKPINHPQELIA